MTARANPSNVSLGTYVKQPPLTVASTNVAMVTNGVTIGDAVSVSSDMGCWDTTANVAVAPEYTSSAVPLE